MNTLSAMFRSVAGSLVTTLLLGGCASSVITDPESPYSQVPVGSTLTINEPLRISTGTTRMYLQNGAVSYGFNSYAPNCNLEVRKIDHEAAQRVERGEYRVNRVQRSTQEVVEAGRVQVAALGSSLLLAAGQGDSGQSDIYEGYHLWLEGPDPNVMRLSCRGAYAAPSEAYPPSVNEIRHVLGAVMNLEFP